MSVKSMNDSFVFLSMNKSGNLTKNIAAAMERGSYLNLANDLPEAHLTINRNIKSIFKIDVLDALNKGLIQIVFSPVDVKIPASLPFILRATPNDTIQAVVFADIYGRKTQDDKYYVEPKKLYCMLEGAYLALAYYNNPSKFVNNNNVRNNGAEIYATMTMKVLNKKFSLINRDRINAVMYLAAKFYLISILGLPNNETTDNYAKKVIKNANTLQLQYVGDQMIDADFKDLSTFINKLSSESLGLGMTNLSARGFLESFINMYDGSTIYGIELLPYFMYTVLCVNQSSYINHQYALEEIMDRVGPAMFMNIK